MGFRQVLNYRMGLYLPSVVFVHLAFGSSLSLNLHACSVSSSKLMLGSVTVISGIRGSEKVVNNVMVSLVDDWVVVVGFASGNAVGTFSGDIAGCVNDNAGLMVSDSVDDAISVGNAAVMACFSAAAQLSSTVVRPESLLNRLASTIAS